MPPKEKEYRRSKLPTKKAKTILPQHLANRLAQSPLEDDASTPPREASQQPPAQQTAEVIPPPPPLIMMIPNPGFVPPPIQEHVSPSPLAASISEQHTPSSQDDAGAGPSQTARSGPTVQGSRYSHPVETEVTHNGKPIIRVLGNSFLPGKVASKAITAVIQSQFREPYCTWGEIPAMTVDKWLDKFQEHVSWDPKDHYLVEKLFKSKGSKRLSEMLMEVRKNGECPTWIGEGAYKELVAKWKAPDYKEKCTKAKQNRASSKGGSMHTGGSISITEHALRLSDELGREPTVDEIFLKTHTKKKDKSWVDDRSRETYEAYQDKVQQATSQASDGGETTGSVDPSTQLQLWTQSAGGRTRGRLYGVGGLSGRFRHGVSSLTQESRASGTSTQSPTQHSTEVVAQIAAFEERTRKAEEEAREAREEAWEARRKAKEEAQEAREARRIASERDQQFQQQLRELSASVAAIQAHKSRRRHPDYEESDED